MVGFNFRLGEIESAIGIEQLKVKQTHQIQTKDGSNFKCGQKVLNILNTKIFK